MSEELRDPHKAVDYILSNAGRYAKAKAERVYLEEFRKSKKALLMAQSEAKTSAEREQWAYGHGDYLKLLDGIRTAIEIEEGLKWGLEAARIRVDIWRSQEASNRTMDRSAA